MAESDVFNLRAKDFNSKGEIQFPGGVLRLITAGFGMVELM